jgi:hypothetical protein
MEFIQKDHTFSFISFLFCGETSFPCAYVDKRPFIQIASREEEEASGFILLK